MRLFPRWFALGCTLLVATVRSGFALGGDRYVNFAPTAGAFPLSVPTGSTPVCVDPGDYPGVVRATHDLQADLRRVTGRTPAVVGAIPASAPAVVVIGTIGHSALVADLVRRGKLDVSPVRGQWESWVREVVDHPFPGVDRALVIAGSDKRGAIYGIYDVSEQIGVSPWYWWDDVTPDHHDALYVQPGRFVQGPPSVKYRGIFLNDEAPDLTNWVAAKYGYAPVRQNPPVPHGIANYGHAFYARIFEVMLRLRANYLWPAMWDNAFNEDDPENARLADEYGIVMGTSHQEPMLRAQKEWDRRYLRTIGTWNYTKEPDLLQRFWREGIRRNRNYESLITIGLRGANDTPMAPGGPAANRTLLEKIVGVQRDILREEMNPDVTKVPQVWCLYKEVQDFYEDGMRAPDDVTLLWAEDNWGNIRRLPTQDERKRSGGAGVYYHFDYHGGPRNYQWINTNPLPKIWEQMSLAKRYGADRIWIVNVGHFKGYEVPTEFFLNYAWDTHRWNAGNVDDFLTQWATREFGPAHAAAIADIVAKYAKYNGRRKPELLAPDTYSLVSYREAQRVVFDFDAIAARAERLYAEMPPAKRDAFYELVLFPAKASALVNRLYLAAGRNELYARQGRASANAQAAEVHRLFDADVALMAYFNHDFAGGRWDHFMDQTHLGYTTWKDPPHNSLAAIKLQSVNPPVAAGLGVAVEGSRSSWPGAEPAAALPQFDAVNQQRHYLEVYDRGQTPFAFSVQASAPWVRLSTSGGQVGADTRVWVEIDWQHAPAGAASAVVTVSGAGASVPVRVETFRPGVTRDTLHGFVEGDGVVSIEPEHFTGNEPAGATQWLRVADYGRTLSGMRAEAPPYVPPAVPGKDSASLEYRMYLFSAGPVDVTAITSPSLNIMPDRGLRYAVSFDDQPPQIVTVVPQGYRAQNGNRDWEKSVSDNARYTHSTHTLASPGYHTLKFWVVDPGVVLQKIVVNLGGLQPSYLGPPESYRGVAAR
ncbi:MAG TPA: glycosyl hydrolase 115 family protein [Opitutaceae bacterium]|nr:glycosyl hydrolase 115 family protein [Opitutaceae bacterium]